jgi:hypothetical protein
VLVRYHHHGTEESVELKDKVSGFLINGYAHSGINLELISPCRYWHLLVKLTKRGMSRTYPTLKNSHHLCDRKAISSREIAYLYHIDRQEK